VFCVRRLDFMIKKITASLKKLLLSVLIIVAALQASWAKTVLISDIDDTIKSSNILNRWAMIGNAYNVKHPFSGMSDFYNILQREIPELSVYYVSSALTFLMMSYSHGKFLKQNNFPDGELRLRKSTADKDFKVNTISEIILSESPETIILIGDNGERDSNIYHTISEKFPEIKMYQFIRINYPFDKASRISDEQKGFISPAEIALELYQNKLLDKVDVVSQIISHSTEQIFDLPEWVNCLDHKTSLMIFAEDFSNVDLLQRKIEDRCSLNEDFNK